MKRGTKIHFSRPKVQVFIQNNILDQFIAAVQVNWHLQKVLIFVVLAGFSSTTIASGEEDLFGDLETSTSNSTPEKDIQFIFSGTADMRVSRPGKAMSWNDQGEGILAEGAVQKGIETTRFSLPRVALTSDLMINGERSGFFQLNFDDHKNNGTQNFSTGIFEAFLIKNLGAHSFRAGIFVPPISREHPDTAWSTRYTITPSAINTWVGEELKVAGIEYSWQHELNQSHRLEFLFSIYTQNDPAGSILSWRGWTLHDYQLKLADRLRFQPINNFPNNGWASPFKETNGGPAYYSKIEYKIGGQFSLDALHYWNPGAGSTFDGADYDWKTIFTNIGFSYQPTVGLEIIGQYLSGSTFMGSRKAGTFVDNKLFSSYLLLSYKPTKHRWSLRQDYFQVRDDDNMSFDDNNQKGSATTFSYSYDLSKYQVVTAEYTRAISYRKGSTASGDEDPDDDLAMINLRVIF